MADWGLIGQDGAVGLLEAALGQGRLPHALLLAGPEGTGKATAAHQVAARLLCRQGPDTEPCGKCPPCRHRQAGTAPDLLEVTVAAGEEIRIDVIRDLAREVHLTPQESGCRAVILEPAEAMNPYAANALLKVLEEPPGEAVFLLISHRPDRLLPTIRSRCQPVRFRPVPAAAVERWLEEVHARSGEAARLAARLAGGSPGRALALADRPLGEERDAVLEALEGIRRGGGESILEVAKAWADAEVETWLPHLLTWLRDLARVRVTAGRIPEQSLVHGDLGDRLESLARRLPFYATERLARAADRLSDAIPGRESSRLAVEAFLILWWREGRQAGDAASAHGRHG